MKNRCVIIAGGEYSSGRILPGDFVIACDRGYENAMRLGVTPELVIADFDSYKGEVAEGIPVMRLPVEKDYTDLQTAVRYAVDEGYGEIVILSALGGRLDHTFTNLQTVVYAASRGVRVSLIGETDAVYAVVNSSITLPRMDDYMLSVFSMTDVSLGITLRGVKYELTDGTLTRLENIGTSNEWVSEEAYIEVKDGTLLIIASRRN